MNITALLRQERESAEWRRQSLLRVIKCAQEELRQDSQKTSKSRQKFDGIVLAEFNKEFPGFRKALLMLQSAASEYDSCIALASLNTDPEYGGDDSPKYVIGEIEEGVFADHLLDSFDRAFEGLELTLVCKTSHKTVDSLAKAVMRARKLVDRARRSSYRSVKGAWDLANDLHGCLDKVTLAADRASQEIGYRVLALKPDSD